MARSPCLALAAASLLVAAPLLADGSDDWLARRQAQFVQWQAANPRVHQDIAGLKQQTAMLVEHHYEHVAGDAGDERARLLARAGALTEEQRREAGLALREGETLAGAGNCEGAMAKFGKAIDIDPLNGPAHVGIGECLRKAGKLAEASDHFTRAANLPAHDLATELAQLKAMTTLQFLPPPRDSRVARPPVIFRIAGTPGEVWDMPQAPVMTIIPAGEFTMGAPAEEQYFKSSEAQHRVTIRTPLAVAKYNVTPGEFAAFVAAAGYRANDGQGCNTFVDGMFRRDRAADWRNPGFAQSDEDPVVCVSYDDAVAYAAWLSGKTGHTYRLPSEAEWEYATRGGTSTIYHWATEIGKGHANCDGCNSAADPKRTTPGGTYPPNGFGLYDMSGNVWKWLADCWNSTYDGAPTDGSAWTEGNCSLRGRRAGSWFNVSERRPGDVREPGRLRAAGRFGSIPRLRYSSFGFRVVREL